MQFIFDRSEVEVDTSDTQQIVNFCDGVTRGTECAVHQLQKRKFGLVTLTLSNDPVLLYSTAENGKSSFRFHFRMVMI